MSKQNEGVVPSNFECKLFLQRMRQGNMARQLAVLQSLQGLGQNYICIARNVSAFDFLRHPIIARRCGMGRIRCGNRASERGIIRRKQRPRARSHIRPMRRAGLMLPSWHSARPAAQQPSSPAVRQVRINALHAGPLAAMPWMDPGIWNRRGVQVGAFKLPQKRLEFQTAEPSLKSCGIKSCCHKSCRHKSCFSKSCGVEFEFAVFFWRPDLN